MGELASSEKIKYGDSVHNARRFIDEEGYPYGVKHTSNRPHVMPYVWNSVTLAYEVATQTTVTTGSLTVSGVMDLTKIGGVNVGAANPLHVQPGTGATFPVTDNGGSLTVDGTFYPETQPVSGAFYPETQPVSLASVPGGMATEAKQSTLESLTETLQELVGRLAVLASWASSGAPALRTIPIASVSTAVTGTVTASGPVTGAQLIAENWRVSNQLVTLANINNAVGV